MCVRDCHSVLGLCVVANQRPSPQPPRPRACPHYTVLIGVNAMALAIYATIGLMGAFTYRCRGYLFISAVWRRGRVLVGWDAAAGGW